MSRRAKVIGHLIASGELGANEPVTWGKLLEVFDIAEDTPHGVGRRAELQAAGKLPSDDKLTESPEGKKARRERAKASENRAD